ncbi:substrate-binding periplasmic protein [Motilimonas eburnea]|uniref:substrate-binding periplasmic protein n=1 Tax=Motilimonas eburnea TaxID=1737488 RepID=UPI001E3C5B08|nr:transporter substrate-binding domain-containing protein [Motilimonas eburnea]MCE2570867.1 transporter substrate-binding domain-containing protein [Motilimonas eburnea]
MARNSPSFIDALLYFEQSIYASDTMNLLSRLVIIASLFLTWIPLGYTQVLFCVEATEYPPFNYQQRHQQTSDQWVGYDIDVLKRVFIPAKVDYRIIPLPWLRCLKEVERGEIDGAMSASLNPRRQSLYLATQPYYHLTPSYYYLKSAFPHGVNIKQARDLLNLGSVCGIDGFNYDNFGFSPSDAIYRIKALFQLPKMLEQGRCHFFLARQEVFSATLVLNRLTHLEDKLAAQVMPDTKPEPFHILISRQSRHKEQLLSLLNSKIEAMRQSGKLKRLLHYHRYIVTQFEPVTPLPGNQ